MHLPHKMPRAVVQHLIMMRILCYDKYTETIYKALVRISNYNYEVYGLLRDNNFGDIALKQYHWNI